VSSEDKKRAIPLVYRGIAQGNQDFDPGGRNPELEMKGGGMGLVFIQ
jgi:hypothetical protein